MVDYVSQEYINLLGVAAAKALGVTSPGWYFWELRTNSGVGPYTKSQAAHREMDRHYRHLSFTHRHKTLMQKSRLELVGHV